MIKELISKVPIDKIIEKDFRLKRSGRYLRGVEHDSLVIDLKNNRFYWNSLGVSGDALVWLMNINGQSYATALKTLQNYTGLPFTRILERLEEPTPLYQPLLKAFFTLGKYYREYWYKRGYTDETIDYFKLGYTGKAFVIPVVLEDKLCNFQCRTGGMGKKRIWNWAKDRPAYPFNVKHKTKYVFLTEGLPDTITMHQMGLPAMSQISGPYAWRKEWNKYIIKFNLCYVLYDNDKAGIIGSKRTASKLLNRGYVVFWPTFVPDKFDINEAALTYGEEKTKQLILEAMLPHAVHSGDLSIVDKQGGVWDVIKEVRRAIDIKARKII